MIAIPRRLQLDRPDLGQHRPGPLAVAGAAAVTAGRFMLAIPEMIIHLTLER
jgi:hypothetical protein